MKTYAIALTVALIGGAAFAQSVPGVRIGMTGPQAQAVIGGQISELRGRPGSDVIRLGPIGSTRI